MVLLKHMLQHPKQHLLLKQKELSEQLKLQKDLNEAVNAEKAEAREKDFESSKRKAEEALESDRKKRKIIQKYRQEAEENLMKKIKEQEDVKTSKALNEKIKEQQLLEAALVGAARRQNLNATEEDILRAIWNHQKDEAARLEKKRLEYNKY